jgi:hypothetical protein
MNVLLRHRGQGGEFGDGGRVLGPVEGGFAGGGGATVRPGLGGGKARRVGEELDERFAPVLAVAEHPKVGEGFFG